MKVKGEINTSTYQVLDAVCLQIFEFIEEALYFLCKSFVLYTEDPDLGSDLSFDLHSGSLVTLLAQQACHNVPINVM